MELKEVAQVERPGGDVLFVRGFLPAVECEAWIARAERLGFRHGPNPQAAGGATSREQVYRYLACLNDGLVARSLFLKAREYLPTHWPPGRVDRGLLGAHPRIRFFRADPDDAIPIHQDDPSSPIDGAATDFSLMIFLNECLGGTIRFHRGPDGSSPFAELSPETGTAMIFPHSTWHEPGLVLTGRRYVLRADLLYRNG